MEDAVKYFRRVLIDIKKQDALHYNTLKVALPSGRDYDELRELIFRYFRKSGITSGVAASDYMRMIRDMRAEMAFFIENEYYSCPSQEYAFDVVYSRPDVMKYYINALLVSQLLWGHHFRMLKYYRETLPHVGLLGRGIKIADIGSGHGIYTYYTRKVLNVISSDIIDVSEVSLGVVRDIIGTINVNFIQSNIGDYKTDSMYDLVILGEVLEHLNNPIRALLDIRNYLSNNGVLWLTAPTNAPAIDHVFLFRSPDDVIDIVSQAGFGIIGHCEIQASSITGLIGLFCNKKS